MYGQRHLWSGFSSILSRPSLVQNIPTRGTTSHISCRHCSTAALWQTRSGVLVHELKRSGLKRRRIGDVDPALYGNLRGLSSGAGATGRRSPLLESPNSRLKPRDCTPIPNYVYATLASIISIAGALLFSSYTVYAESSIEPTLVTANQASDGLKPRTFRISEVSQHGPHGSTQWIIHGNRVYDITEFIPGHPGGEVILRACGGSIDPYWKIFSIHSKQEVVDILEQYYIGDVDPRDLNANGDDLASGAGEIADPFANDPERDARLITHTSKPCNAETPAELLTDSFITPLKLFFVRNHLWVPQIDPSSHTVAIELSNGDRKEYTMEDLKSKFAERTITMTLQCAGNRRAHMSASSVGPTSGLQWDIGAIGTAEFTGVRLRDVLSDAGYDFDAAYDNAADEEASRDADSETDRHVHFMSPGDTYVASVPLLTAISPTSDVLLAYKMNGEPLPPDHGGPLRAIVPGTVAARSVKWLGRISIEQEEAQSQWQKRDYKCFGPNVRAADVTESDWDEQSSIQELPVQSAVTAIKKHEGHSEIQGYAMSGGGREIVRVDVSTDGGRTWQQAQLRQNGSKSARRWAWTLWSLTVPKEELNFEKGNLVVKAVDEAYNTQPESFDAIWNFRGLLGNAWHRVTVSSKE